MYVVLINADHLPDADSCLPPRVQPFSGKPAIPLSCWGKTEELKRAVARSVDGINYVSPLAWYVIDTKNQGDLVKWLDKWKQMDFHFTMGKFWFDDIGDFEDWLAKLGCAFDDASEFDRYVDGWKV